VTAVREGYVPVSDGRVWYRITGAEQPGIPLLCLHGGPGAPHDYLVTLEGFADERPVVFYDQMGCGNSERPRDPAHWTIGQFVEELAAVREELELSPLHLLGQSWGTILAVEYVLRKKPGVVVSLILSGPVMSFPRFIEDQREALSRMPREQQQVIARAEARGDFSSPAYLDAMMDFYRQHLYRLHPWPEAMNLTMEKLDHAVYEYMQGPSEFTVTGTLRDYDLVDRLGELSLPVLYTCGEYDECTPSATEYYHLRTPRSEYVVFRGASHEHHLEKPDEYLRVVGDFMRRVERRL
jgi:proline iminopeptidase